MGTNARHAASTPGGILVLVISMLLSGCSTSKGTGALAGAGIGTLIGAATGGTQAAIVGAAIGTGVGYIIGDQVDQKKAKEMSAQGNTHNEVGALGGTRWKLVSVNSKRPVEPYVSKVVEFMPNGRVVTTTTRQDTTVVVFDESYRVVGSTLIVNKPGYMVNAIFQLSGNQLIVNDPDFSAVLQRL